MAEADEDIVDLLAEAAEEQLALVAVADRQDGDERPELMTASEVLEQVTGDVSAPTESDEDAADGHVGNGEAAQSPDESKEAEGVTASVNDGESCEAPADELGATQKKVGVHGKDKFGVPYKRQGKDMLVATSSTQLGNFCVAPIISAFSQVQEATKEYEDKPQLNDDLRIPDQFAIKNMRE